MLGANCTATLPNYTSLATTGDNCGVQSVTQSPIAGTTVSGAGNMTVTLTVTDINGSETECTFTVTKVDNTPPTVTCPATQTLVLGANCTATLPNYTSMATTGDNCGVQSVTQSPSAGTNVSGAGNMTVTLTVTDVNGNETECTFTVTKVDNTPPTISCPTTQTLVLGANCTATLPNYTSCHHRRQLRRTKRDTIADRGNHGFRRRQHDHNTHGNRHQRQRNRMHVHRNKSGQHAADHHLPGHANFSAWRKLHGNFTELHELGHHGRQLRRTKRDTIANSRHIGFQRR